MIELEIKEQFLNIFFKGEKLFHHSITSPLISIGYGEPKFRVSHGIYKISEDIKNEIPLADFNVISQSKLKVEIEFGGKLYVIFQVSNDRLEIRFKTDYNYINRFWINLLANEDEHIYGCGEQYSKLDLKGELVPLWCEEQGIGRGKDILTFLAEITRGAGGNEFTTYYPQPTFVSSKNLFCHIETNAYSIFDFREAKRHELYIWEIPQKIVIDKRDTAVEILKSLSNYLGKQPKLPDWVYDGVWLGLQGGKDIIKSKIEKAEQEDIKISAVWAQDWEGKRITKFGSQLMWNWKYDENIYPNLPKFIKELNKKDIKFLGYINPFLAIEKELYTEASEKGYLVKDKADEDYLINVTYFPASLLDLSNPDAIKWIKDVIKKNMIEIGLSGWMSDFGEYLPINCKLYSETDLEKFHNQYPVIWAKINKEAIEEYNEEHQNKSTSKDTDNEIVFFSRAGFTGTSQYSPIIWAGDQNVNWSMNDGLATVIPAGISLGFSGIGIHHSDIGGYTTVAWLKRTKELFMRWTEQSVFTTIMRTHEGNRPKRNWQFDSDKETLFHFAKMSKIHKHIKPYIKHTTNEYYQNGLPVMRHPYIHYENDEELHKIKYQYLFGRDIMVAPVYKPRRKSWKIYLPEDKWIHLWSGKEYLSGWIKVLSPLGEPPVFYRKSSEFNKLFSEITEIK